MKKDEVKNNTGVDDPLIDPVNDCLDRDLFAKRIYTLIDSTPLAGRLRVGIFGDWGSGKTTAMNFIKYYCRENGHAVVDFHPWRYHSREEAWKGFVASVEDGLCKWKKTILLKTRVGKFVINHIRGTLWIIKRISEVHQISKSLSDLIISPLQGALEEKKEKTTTRLKKILRNKRLYVFIDDLDRAETHNKLKELSEKAKENIEIQKNFVEVLRMFYYGATDGIGWATQQEVQKLINKKEFFGSVWNGATCRPLNRRLVGSLEDYIKKLSSVVTDEKVFERPQWWLALTADKVSQNQTKKKEEVHA